jgi:hypothetical protein
MTTYTLVDHNGTVLNQGLTAVEAMDEILTYDGYRYEIKDSYLNGLVCWDLWHSDGSENSPRGASHMRPTILHSFEEDEAKARQDIAEQLIKAGWSRMPEAMTDEDYAAMMADLAAQEADDDC